VYKSKISISVRKNILDPQGKAVEHSLKSMGFEKILDTRIGKYIELVIDAGSEKEAFDLSEEACKKLLANPVMEDYTIAVQKEGEQN
jgi:phosphoribosylformylglycinamidine synthase PurS subunit